MSRRIGRLAGVLGLVILTSVVHAPSPVVGSAPAGLFDRVAATPLGNDRSVFAQVVTSGDGVFHSVVRQDTALSQQILYRTSRDGGRTWQFNAAFSGSSGSGATKPVIAVDGKNVAIAFVGTLCLTFDTCLPTPHLTVSNDQGVTWSPVRRLSDAETTSVTVAQDGNRTWVAWDRLDRGPVQLRSTLDGGESFGIERQFPGIFLPMLSADGGIAALGGVSANGSSVVLASTFTVGPVRSLPGRLVGLASADGRVHAALLGDRFAVSTVEATSPSALWGEPKVVGKGRPSQATIDARPGLVAVGWSEYESTASSRRAQAFVASSLDGGRSFTEPVDVGENPDGVVLSALVSVARTATDGPVARFDWDVPDRYIDGDDPDTLRDPANSTNVSDLDRILVDVIDLDVHLDGCDSVATAPGTSIADYTWIVDGVTLPDHTCEVTASMRDGVASDVVLEVTDSAGMTGRNSLTVTPEDLLIVSIGDSVASGEGNPHIPTEFGLLNLPGSLDKKTTAPAWTPEKWQDDPCHRSAYSGPALAAQQIEDADTRTSVTFVQLSCSGAAIMDVPSSPGSLPSGADDPDTGGVLDPYHGVEPYGIKPRLSQLDQLQALRGTRPVDAVFVSIGANDVKFSEVVEQCLTKTPDTFASCDTSSTKTNLDTRLTDLPRRYAALASRLSSIGVAPGDVYVTEYFDQTEDEYGRANLRCAGEGAGLFAGIVATAIDPLLGALALAVLSGGLITDDEAAWAKDYVGPKLNEAVRAAATTHGWRYVGGIASAFARHGYCSSDPWVVSLSESIEAQGDINGAFHPNKAGHVAYGNAIARAYANDHLPTTTAESDVLSGSERHGDVYALVADGHSVTAVSLRDTGSTLLPLGARRLVDVLPGMEYHDATPTSPVAASATAAAATWNEGWESWRWYQAWAAPVTVVEDVAVTGVTLSQAPAIAATALAAHPTYVLAVLSAELSMPRELAVRVQVADGEGSVLDTTTDLLVRPGREVYVLPLDSPIELRSGTATATVTVTDPPGAGAAAAANNSANSPAVEVRAGREALITMVPTVTTDGSSVTCGQAAAAASSQGRYATAAIPALAVEVELDCTAPAPITPDTGGVLRALVELDQYAQLTGRDAVVGVVPAGWLQRVSGQAIGVTGFDLRGILVEAGSAPSTLSHELAHTLGVDHTDGGRAIGINTSTRTVVDGTDWMFFRSVRPDWTSGPVWDAMLLGLGGPDARPMPPDFTDGSVFIRGVVYQNESGAWVYSPGRWTTGGTGEPPPPDLSELELERIVARQTDTDTGTVIDTPVPLAPVEAKLGPNGTIGDLQELGLVASWPVEIDASSDRIDILLDGQIVETRTISPGDPIVEVTAPTAGTSVTRGEPMEITWNSSDPDGDLLTFDLLISGDGGITWEPLASGVSGSSATVTAPADQDGDAIVVRVIASDGIRQGSDDSDPFSITFVGRGPEQVYFERIEFCADFSGFAATCPTGLSVMAPDGTGERSLVEFELPVADITAPAEVSPLTRAWWPEKPSISPDGRTLAFQIQWENFRFGIGDNAVGIALADHDGRNRRLITSSVLIPGEARRWLEIDCPSWSPDGTRLAALGYATSGDSGPARTYVLTMAPDGSDLRFAGVHQWSNRGACPSWSPDGARLAVAVRRTSYDVASLWPAGMPPVTPDTVWTLLGWDASGNDAAVGQLLGFIGRDVDPTTGNRLGELGSTAGSVGTLVQEPDGSILAPLSASWILCGVVRILPAGAGQERVMTCPRTRIVVATDPPGTGRPNISGYDPPHIQYAPDGRLAISSGKQFIHSSYVDSLAGFTPSLCTIPGDSLAEPLVQSTLGNNYLPPGHECVTGPGTTAPTPTVANVVGQLHHAWSAGTVLDGPGSGLVSIPPETPASPADPGGPYAAVVGAPVVIDAGASARLVGDDGTALVEWDLDGDGEFDDAVGTRPTVTFEQPGSFQVRVRITVGAGPAVVSEPTTADISAAPDVAVVAAPDISEPRGAIPEPADQTVTVPAGITTFVDLELAGGGSTAFQIVGAPDAADMSIAIPGAAPGVDGLVTGPDGRVAVTPAAGFAGTRTATFRVAGIEGPTATLTIEVAAPPTPRANPDDLTVTAGVLAVIDPANLLDNDAPASLAPPGAALAAQQLSGLRIVGVNGADNGVAWLDLNGMVNVLARTPGAGSFRYTVADGSLIADGTVSLVVNAPTAPTTTAPTTAAPTTAAPLPPTTDAPPTTVTSPLPPTPLQTTPPVTQPPLAGELPETGSDIGRPLRMATVLVVAGLAALVIVHSRRRRPGLRD